MRTVSFVDRLTQADTASPEAAVLSRNRHRLIAHILALALLIAQVGVIAHADAHLTSDAHGVPSAIQNCGQCLSSAPLLAMVGSSQRVWLDHEFHSVRVAPADTVVVAASLSCPAFRSRAPPRVS